MKILTNFYFASAVFGLILAIAGLDVFDWKTWLVIAGALYLANTFEDKNKKFICDLCHKETDDPTYTDIGVVCEECLKTNLIFKNQV